VDETYVKVAGQWRYVYRAIDQVGQVIDVVATPRRDAKAAHRFFQRAIGATLGSGRGCGGARGSA
jgi:transposase, IS6 family